MRDDPGHLVTAEWLNAHVDDVVVADIRWYLDGRSGRDAYTAGHIPGAVFVDLDEHLSAPPGETGRHPLPSPAGFARAMGSLGISNDAVVIAYDDAGGLVAARFWWMLRSIGTTAAVLDGGIQSWSGDLETDQPSIEPTRFQPRPWDPGRFVTADQVAQRSSDVLLVDARSRERYHGTPNQIDPRFGHIPGALNLPFSSNVGDNHVFLAGTELAKRYAELGIDADSEVIAYCGSGVSACGDLLGLTEAGVHDLKLYVGSWSEWGADPSRPLETS
ncbi:MAG: sulfurtransferase [Acidimicrobiales bacterium]